jgi:hypothetical protein
MDSLFVISPVLSMFLPGGILRPFLHTCTAAIIAAHEHFAMKFGSTNKLVDKVKITAEKLNLCCGDATGEQVIRKWGKVINADFRERNRTHFEPKIPRDLGLKLDLTVGLMYQIQQSQADSQGKLLLVHEELREKSAEVLLAREELQRLKEELMSLKRARAVDAQEETLSPSKRGTRHQDPEQRHSPARNNVGEEEVAQM